MERNKFKLYGLVILVKLLFVIHHVSTEIVFLQVFVIVILDGRVLNV